MESTGDRTLEECNAALRQHRERLLRLKNVVGVGVGKKVVGGEVTDELCVTVFVRKKEPLEALEERDVVPGKVDAVKTDVIQTGEFIAYARTDRLRPCPPGMSIGHPQVTAGTFGCVVLDDQGRQVILSNNHVLANSNDARLGDAILQPGRIDGGTLEDAIGRLHRFKQIHFDDGPSPCPAARTTSTLLNALAGLLGRRSRLRATLPVPEHNLVDAAIGLPDRTEDIESGILDIGEPTGVEEAFIGMEVTKSGRTTGTTVGRVTQINATVRVSYGPGRMATFEDQLVIMNGEFSAPGDSGSAICTVEETGPKLVGLLFAGGESATIANSMGNIFNLLDVSL